jgi:hypothetical protein
MSVGSLQISSTTNFFFPLRIVYSLLPVKFSCTFLSEASSAVSFASSASKVTKHASGSYQSLMFAVSCFSISISFSFSFAVLKSKAFKAAPLSYRSPINF